MLSYSSSSHLSHATYFFQSLIQKSKFNAQRKVEMLCELFAENKYCIS